MLTTLQPPVVADSASTTHAACANRTIEMRDGRIRTDRTNPSPLDAMAALASLHDVDDGDEALAS